MKTDFIPKLLKTISVGVLCSTVMLGNVLGDVFKAQLNDADHTNATIQQGNNTDENVAAFTTFIGRHLRNGAFVGLQNPFGNDMPWQLGGCAVFFPDGKNGDPQQVYIGKKRSSRIHSNGAVVSNDPNNPDPNKRGSLSNFGFNIHLERQLVMVALNNACAQREEDMLPNATNDFSRIEQVTGPTLTINDTCKELTRDIAENTPENLPVDQANAVEQTRESISTINGNATKIARTIDWRNNFTEDNLRREIFQIRQEITQQITNLQNQLNAPAPIPENINNIINRALPRITSAVNDLNAINVHEIYEQIQATHARANEIARIVTDNWNAHHNDIQGELHIFLTATPCVKTNAEDGNISCINYYHQLAQQFPKVRFHIYFPTKEIIFDGASIADYAQSRNMFCRLLYDKVNDGNDLWRNGRADGEGALQINNNMMQRQHITGANIEWQPLWKRNRADTRWVNNGNHSLDDVKFARPVIQLADKSVNELIIPRLINAQQWNELRNIFEIHALAHDEATTPDEEAAINARIMYHDIH